MKWKTEKRKISDLVPYEHNPRQMTEKQRQDLEKSLLKFDLAEIPAINTDNTILAGHMRLRILSGLGRGEEKIDVRVPSRKLTAKEVQEYNIRSNKNLGEWDMDKLGNAFEPEDLKAWGFEDSELFGEEGGELQNEQEDVPDLPTNPTTKPGDLWVLGEHRLLCGDSASGGDIVAVLGDEKASCIFTDPPYGVSIGAKNRFLNSFQKAGRNLKDIESDDMSPEDLKKMLLPIFVNVKKLVMADDCTLFCCAPQGGELGMMMMMMQEAGLRPRHVLIWKKNSPTFSMGRLDYDYQHEPILLTWGKKHKRPMLGMYKTSVWEVDKPRANKEHPTMKPVELYANAYLNNSDKGDIVFEPFCGSGTAIIAAEQTSRKCCAIEISPHYCDVAIKRWMNLSGGEPVSPSGAKWGK